MNNKTTVTTVMQELLQRHKFQIPVAYARRKTFEKPIKNMFLTLRLDTNWSNNEPTITKTTTHSSYNFKIKKIRPLTFVQIFSYSRLYLYLGFLRLLNTKLEQDSSIT